jgi:tetratricopeptide (TPR) repeat protein
MGDCWYALKNLDQAVLEYDTAVALAGDFYCDQQTYSMRGLVYTQRREYDKALEAWYLARLTSGKGTEYYSTALYNIWQLEWKKGSFAPAESAFNDLIQQCHSSKECPVDDCYDYYACARVIQIYYRLEEYEKAKPYKAKLYEAHRKGYRADHLKEMFCFDSFEWRDKVVEAFERYEESDTTVYAKHIFFLKNQWGEEEFRIQSVYSPGTDWRRGDQYVMCKLSGQTHSTFDIRFKRDAGYADMKKAVIQILDGKARPMSH